MIVVLDASALVSAALKANSIPERALLRAVEVPNRLLLSSEVEAEYREVIFRPKFDRFATVERRRLVLDIVQIGANGSNHARRFASAATRKMTSI